MQEVKSLKNEVNELKKSMEVNQNGLKERVNDVEENMSEAWQKFTSIKLIYTMWMIVWQT